LSRRHKKKLILRSLIVIISVLASCTGGFFSWVALDTNDSATKADEFLFALQSRETVEAYHTHTTAHFRAVQDSVEFEKTMDLLGLPLTYKIDAWRDRRLERENISKIRGTLIDLGGQDVKFTVDMVKEKDDWKVNAFQDDDRMGVGPGAWFKQIPLREDLYVLTAESVKRFREAIEEKSFLDFYDYMSNSFKIGISLERLEQGYIPYMALDLDMTGVENLEPVYLELPNLQSFAIGIDEQVEFEIKDVMVLRGYYPLRPKPIPFIFRYVYEHPEWKLFQFQVLEPTISALPPEICLEWLLRQEDKNPNQCFDVGASKRQRGIITFGEDFVMPGSAQ